MASGDIPDSAITTSSLRPDDLMPNEGRLHWTIKGPLQGWAVQTLDLTQWLKIDVGVVRFITGVATQGRHRYDQYVTKYRLSYSMDDKTWIDYQNKTEFPGNKGPDDVVRHQLSPVIWARFIRFHPLKYHGYITMRVEVYSFRRASPTSLGIEYGNREVPLDHITASSFKDNDTQPYMAMLNYPFKFRGWCSKHSAGQWLQFNFGHAMIVTGIVTQATGGINPQWLKKYKVWHSLKNWHVYKENSIIKIFTGNSNPLGYAVRKIKDTKASMVRITAVEFTGDTVCCRASVLGRRNGPLGAPVFAPWNSRYIVGYTNDNVKEKLNIATVGDVPLSFAIMSKGVKTSATILQANSQHQGIYTITASNSVGTSKTAMYLQIKDSLELCTNHEIISGSDSFLTSVGFQSGDKNILQELKANTWYRFIGEDGYSYRPTTTCTPKKHCKAKNTGYLSKSMPYVNEGIMKIKACFNKNGKCCDTKMNIYVRNCKQFYIYKVEKKASDEFGICLVKYRPDFPNKMFASMLQPLALHNHVIRRFFDVYEVMACMNYCTMVKECTSLNYSQKKVTCELNDATAVEFPKDLQHRSDFLYYYAQEYMESVMVRDEF